ncbi:hypothetical protein PBT90_06810 [Algoriphagus halophytocola]|uniref:T9SS type A sorting domain-containing protein n=1 Tax=Algoriphagus halophytocola TaxID=2991499 RepID=A0ABY6MH42_9BACT|nr:MULTISPECIES: hypothetical protein [unclassified Algoriphagus]UZD23100.1 hypothetical protein OM944_01130 [Algoriphagus sp. TR-M5]WBL44392.1 hypothetical protein PBT90_06810 [Algoriphagus sp. TR-M9]
MKTLFTFALAGLLATSSFAADKAEDLMALSSAHTVYKKVHVHLKEGVGKAKIAIYDMEGNKLHQRTVKAKEDMNVPYDLNSLPCGEYTVKISTNDEEVMYTVETVEKVEPKAEVLPLVAYGKKMNSFTIGLTVLGLEQAGVDVKIRAVGSDHIVHEEYIDQPEGFKKNFVLNGVRPEEVYFDVTDVKGRNRVIHF